MQRAEKGHDNRGMEQLELASATSWQLSQLCLSQLKWQLRWQWYGLASIHAGYGYGFSRVLAGAATTLCQGHLGMPPLQLLATKLCKGSGSKRENHDLLLHDRYERGQVAH